LAWNIVKINLRYQKKHKIVSNIACQRPNQSGYQWEMHRMMDGSSIESLTNEDQIQNSGAKPE